MAKPTKKEQFIELMKNWEYDSEAGAECANLCMARPNDVSFHDWVKQTDWTLGAIIANFRYHCIYLNGGIDWEAFENLWYCFKMKIYACIE
jgi:hypothetical protein